MMALLDIFPLGFVSQFAMLKGARRKQFPCETQVNEILQLLDRSGKSDLAEKISGSLNTGRFDRLDVVEKLERDLSSESYPFGIEEWRRYSEARAKSDTRRSIRHPGDITLLAFAAHRIREGIREA